MIQFGVRVDVCLCCFLEEAAFVVIARRWDSHAMSRVCAGRAALKLLRSYLACRLPKRSVRSKRSSPVANRSSDHAANRVSLSALTAVPKLFRAFDKTSLLNRPTLLLSTRTLGLRKQNCSNQNTFYFASSDVL